MFVLTGFSVSPSSFFPACFLRMLASSALHGESESRDGEFRVSVSRCQRELSLSAVISCL